MKRKFRGFYPEEIIFSATSECNLHCRHCFVQRNNTKLDVEEAINFLENCKDTSITKVGFSGGEPFLYTNFLYEIVKACMERDFLFDQIITNGDWWHTEQELTQTLQHLYDIGYDGNIGLSWDNFHNQKIERMSIFIKTVQRIFGQNAINIQYVNSASNDDTTPLEISPSLIKSHFPDVNLFILPQTYPYTNKNAWKAKKWFREDYCQGPGNVFYIHTNGKIAPCCGFANEEEKLFIGTIKDSYQTLIENAQNNSMINICFNKGLHTKIKIWKKYCKNHPDLPKGKTSDICTFCQAVCKINN